MALEVQEIGKRFGGRAVVRDVSFRVDDGELVALLGPSGSGKSTILRIVAGLAPADTGRVLVDGVDVTALAPQARDLGFVFQNYALFEHLTIAGNVEFALRVRRVRRKDRQLRRDELLELVGLGGSARKYPSQLSGGQRQRTALARALAHRPRLLLLDEPFGALDARIRQELRQGLRELLKRIGTTAVFVTHDQEEAFAVADRIMVLHRGRLLEQGPADTLYRAPRTEFVAGFEGRANLLPGEVSPEGVRVRLEAAPARQDAAPHRVKALIRPEQLRVLPLSDAAHRPAGFQAEAVVDRTEYLGSGERVLMVIEPAAGDGARRRHRLEALRTAAAVAAHPLAAGDRVTVMADALHAIAQPDLRLLVVAGPDEAGRHLVEETLAFGERTHALVTVIGGAVGAPALRAPLEHFRQTFAGDLKLVDVDADDASLLDAARLHLEGASHDLVLLPERLCDPQAVLRFLAGTDTRQLLLGGEGRGPLAATGDCWRAWLRAFAATQPDLDLLSELAGTSGARVDVRDLAGAHPETAPARWYDALAFREVPFTVDRPLAVGHAPPDEIAGDADAVVVDLGPRSALGERQRRWLEAVRGHWTFLLVQPDEADLGLGPSAHLPADPRALALKPEPST